MGYRLRELISNRWVRLHSLPNSKRYAETEGEYDLILSRANSLANELFECNESIWVTSSRPDDIVGIIEHGPSPYTKERGKLKHTFNWTDPTEAPEDRIIWSTHAITTKWNTQTFDDVFLRIADDEDYGILFIKYDMSCILAPYDGGFDLIVKNSSDVQTLKRKYSSWLSSRADGL